MHHAGLVRGGEALARLEQHVEDLFPGAWARVVPLPEVRALDEVHRDEQPPLVLPHVIDADDVGVVEPRQRLRLATQAGGGLGHPVIAAGTHELQGDLAVELGVEGGVHLAHAAATHLFEDGVATDFARQRRRLFVDDMIVRLADIQRRFGRFHPIVDYAIGGL